MDGQLTLEAPAKINLWLRVLGRREDGFHDLDTRMLALELADTVTLSPVAKGVRLRCSDADLPAGEGNLAYDAAALFLRETGVGGGVEIGLEKRIPAGAGLGGGSSDAAAVLRGLDQLFETGLGPAGLLPIAASLGSDIPFFLYGVPCDCSGRGEIVEPLELAIPDREVLLLRPAFPISTPWAFGALADSREIPGVPYGPQESPWGNLVNDLERPAFSKHLVLADMKCWLLAQPEVELALMSGSGSTIFAILGAGVTSTSERPDAADDLRARSLLRFGETTWIQPTCFAAG